MPAAPAPRSGDRLRPLRRGRARSWLHRSAGKLRQDRSGESSPDVSPLAKHTPPAKNVGKTHGHASVPSGFSRSAQRRDDQGKVADSRTLEGSARRRRQDLGTGARRRAAVPSRETRTGRPLPYDGDGRPTNNHNSGDVREVATCRAVARHEAKQASQNVVVNGEDQNAERAGVRQAKIRARLRQRSRGPRRSGGISRGETISENFSEFARRARSARVVGMEPSSEIVELDRRRKECLRLAIAALPPSENITRVLDASREIERFLAIPSKPPQARRIGFLQE